ncbi:MAG: S9 family peptidase, partial [Bacteroidaceae bacterium]|nr:S9 family peptidase [Bacteroidaceae bacterium]
YAKDLNLYRMSRADYEKAKKDEKDSTIVETQLTTFGTEHFGFGQPYSLLDTDTLCNGKRKRVGIAWSPDSRHFAVTLEDQRKVKNLWVINSMASPRPTLETYKYEMPGDKEVPQVHLYVFDLQTDTCKEVNVQRYKDQTINIEYQRLSPSTRDLHELSYQWMGNEGELFVNRFSRDLKKHDVCKYVVGEDTLRTLIHEEMNTYISEWLDESTTSRFEILNGGKEMVKWSERNGWAHLYLYDQDGKLKNAITEGPYHVHGIVKVDEKAREVYFTAMGKNPRVNPYYQHLYKVSLNGGEPRRLTASESFHNISANDQCQFFVDNFSRVDTIPVTTLVDKNGKKVMNLEVADMEQLFANGYQFPEQFRVKAADGVTDLWGVMYKPFDFDSTKVYPIIDYVYPGPQVEGTVYPFTRMGVRTDRLAQAGFIVISVGNRGGHPNRSMWYHTFGYGNLRDYGLADQKAAIEQLANRYSFIDINKVGIHGHSGGGFMSTAAILKYPDFFKAAVSCAGNHDNRIYNRWWSETHHGVKEKVSEKNDTTFAFQISTNPELASRLKGHLMLVTGDIDNNVHPANTYRVADALIRANKRFDMLVLPQQRHGFGDMNEYFYWRLVDYFSEHLKGKKEHSVNIPQP